VGLKAGPDVMGQGKISCPNPDSSVVQPVAWPLFRLTYLGSHIGYGSVRLDEGRPFSVVGYFTTSVAGQCSVEP
jgi:hypothetical protein